LVYSTPKHRLPSSLLRLQVLFTAELNRRLAAAGSSVQALSLHPGNVLTNVVQSLPAAIQSLYRAIMVRVLLTPEQGAAQRPMHMNGCGLFPDAVSRRSSTHINIIGARLRLRCCMGVGLCVVCPQRAACQGH
jgi:hypothetical protein